MQKYITDGVTATPPAQQLLCVLSAVKRSQQKLLTVFRMLTAHTQQHLQTLCQEQKPIVANSKQRIADSFQFYSLIANRYLLNKIHFLSKYKNRALAEKSAGVLFLAISCQSPATGVVAITSFFLIYFIKDIEKIIQHDTVSGMRTGGWKLATDD